MRLSVEFAFSAAHRLPRHPGRCFHLHGHNYRLVVTVEGPADPDTGMVMDFDDLEAAVEAAALVRARASYLNEFIENPTAENICRWLWRRLAPTLPSLSELTLFETPQLRVTWTAADAAGEDGR